MRLIHLGFCRSITPKSSIVEFPNGSSCTQHLLLDFQNVPIIHGRYEADQKCCSSPQHFKTGQLRNLPLFRRCDSVSLLYKAVNVNLRPPLEAWIAYTCYIPTRHPKLIFKSRHLSLAKMWTQHSTFLPPISFTCIAPDWSRQPMIYALYWVLSLLCHGRMLVRKNLNWCTPFFCCKPVNGTYWSNGSIHGNNRGKGHAFIHICSLAWKSASSLPWGGNALFQVAMLS